MRKLYTLTLLLLIISTIGNSQTVPISDFFPDIKVMNSNGPAPGYFFLATQGVSAPGGVLYIAIVDNYGTPVFFRIMPSIAVSMRLINDGTIGYAHGVPRRLYLLDEMLDVREVISTIGYNMDGHDWEIDDNLGGSYNRLLFAKYTRVVDMSLLVDGGNPEAVINEHVLQELSPENVVLKQWYTENLFSILDANENSNFVNLTGSPIDYAHLNSIALSSDTSFYVSTRHIDEITNIDRRTGQVIWRLGGKNNQFTFINDTIGFSHQHCPRKLENGNILIFDNGNLHTNQVSSVVEYKLDETNFTATLVRRFRRSPDAFSPRDGASQRLPNGNTIATWGPGWPSLTEFHPDGSVAIELDFTHHSLSPRIEKFMWKTKIFETSSEDLDFGTWNGIDQVERRITLRNNADTTMHITSYSTRSPYFTLATPLPLILLPGIDKEISILFNPAGANTGFITDVITLNSDNETQRIARQVRLNGRQEDNNPPQLTISPDGSEVALSTLITLVFNEPVRRIDGAELDYLNVDDLIILRKESATGENIPFNATISSDKKMIEVRPDNLLDEGSVYWISVTDQFEDYSGNRLPVYSGSTFTTGFATAVREAVTLPRVKIYPNPGRGLFSVKTDYHGTLNTSVYSHLGVRVYEKPDLQGPDFQIDLAGSGPGIYFLIMQSSDGSVLVRHSLIISK